MAAALASADALAHRLQVTSIDAGVADRVLTDASGLVRAIARQYFDFVSQETVILQGGGRVLTLPERPLVVDGTNPLTVVELGDFNGVDIIAVEGRDYVRTGNELTRGYPWQWTTSRLMGWPYNRPLGTWAPRVRATYSHGYSAIPDDVVAIVLDVAQLLYANPGGLRSVSIGDYSETYAIETLGRDLVETIRKRLSATGRRRGAHSIQLT